MTTSALFTEQQAEALVGRFVRARRHWSGVPGGAYGLIVATSPGPNGWSVVISWNLPREIKRQADRLTVGPQEFERTLEEIDYH